MSLLAAAGGQEALSKTIAEQSSCSPAVSTRPCVECIGGGGSFHEFWEFTRPPVATVAGFNPFFGFYTAAIPTNEVLASYSVNKPCVDIKAGRRGWYQMA